MPLGCSIVFLLAFLCIPLGRFLDAREKHKKEKEFHMHTPDDAFVYAEYSAIWYDFNKDTLHWYSPIDKAKAVSIDYISKFELDGDIVHDPIISGGGTSWITGMNKKITTQTRIYDGRITVLYLQGLNWNRKVLFSGEDVFQHFLEWFPDKEGAVVDAIRRQELVEKQLSNRRNKL